MKLVFAAPESGLPSLLTALPSQASCLHFLTKLVLAAPLSALPSLPTALVSHDCAMADPTAKTVIRAARAIRFIVSSVNVVLNSIDDVFSIDGCDDAWQFIAALNRSIFLARAWSTASCNRRWHCLAMRQQNSE